MTERGTAFVQTTDGQRTLEQVLASLLKHQSHQLDALNAATP
jgi:hypothetical protein